MNTFSMRAECHQDVDLLVMLLTAASPNSKLSTKSGAPGFPDELVEIFTDLEMDRVKELIRAVPDGHVMLQTIRPLPLSENSLERDWSVL